MKVTIHFRDEKVEEFENVDEVNFSEGMQCLNFYTDEEQLNEVYIPITSVKYWREIEEPGDDDE